MNDMDESLDSNASNNNSNESPYKSDELAESSEITKNLAPDNENSDDGCVDSEDEEDENKSDPGEVDVNDDRSQTPVQDEVESNQSEKLENSHEDVHADQPDMKEIEKSPSELKENEFPTDVNGVQEDEDKAHESVANPEFKGNELNDDHGELDYEEDVDDNKVPNKAMDDVSDDNSDSGEVDSNSNKHSKEQEGDKEFHSSDGELLDDEDCEEGEIKEPGSRRQYQRPLCRFFTRGSCTWGMNCRFLHPGINDKGNYSMLHHLQYNQAPTMPPPIRAPHFSNVHERLGNRAVPTEQGEVGEGGHKGVVGGSGSAPESAWERGLRHAKEIRNKTKTGDGDDKKDTSPVSSPSPSPTNHVRAPQLAPPPPRDPFYEDLHRPHPPMMPGMPPMHPMHMAPPPLQPHPMEGWPYRPPHHGDFDAMRWPRPPHMHPHQPHDFLHQPFQPQYDYRMQGRDRRFSPPHRMNNNRFERFGRPAEALNRGRPDDWKDPWSRTKTSKSKKVSSSRSGSRKRSRTSYSSFTSSSYSSRSRSRSASSYSSSRSSSRSSSSRSHSRLKSPAQRSRRASINKLPRNHSDAAKTKINPKVIPPSLADLNSSPVHKAPPTKQKVPANLPLSSPKPTPPKPLVLPPPAPVVSPVAKESPAPPPLPPVMKTPMQITLPSKPTKSLSKTSQLHKSVAEAFKDADDDDDERARKKPRLSKFSPEESLAEGKGATAVMAGGVTYKSGMVQGNVGYPVPVKPPQDASKNPLADLKRKKLPDKFARSRDSSDSRSSYSSSSSGSSGSSSSSRSQHSKRYSHLASPISSDSSASPSKQKAKLDRLRLAKAPQDLTGYPRGGSTAGFPHDRNGMRGGHFRGARGGEHVPERREYRGDNRPYDEAQRAPPRRPDYHRHPGEFRNNPPFPGEPAGRDRSEGGRKQADMSRFERPDFSRDSREYRGKEDEGRGDMYRYGDDRPPRGLRQGMYRGAKGGRGRFQRAAEEYDDRPKRESPPPDLRRSFHAPPPSNKPPDSRYNQPEHFPRRPSKEPTSFRKRAMSPLADKVLQPAKGADEGGRMGRVGGHKTAVRHDRREELLMQLKAVEDAIAKKKNKNM